MIQQAQRDINHKLRVLNHALEKPICAKCPIRCYSKEISRKIQDVIHIAGLKMTLSHSLFLLLHGVDR